MKKIDTRLVFQTVLFAVLLLCLPVQKLMAQNDEPEYTYKLFYENLAPYGQWIEDSQYGYVWSPDVEGGFRPYFTKGHWAMTQYGNTWVSDYLWGWACFHYGRWVFDSWYGWLWVPGADWGAAWVMWRSGVGYFGWAPLSPDYKFKPNLVADPYFPPKDWWVFLPPQYLYSANYYSYWSGPTGNSTLLKNTKQINNYYEYNGITYISGPYTKQVEKVVNKHIDIYHLGISGNLITKIHLEEIKMFRPIEIRALSVFGNNPIPPGVIDAPRPVTQTLQSINAQLGKPVPPFRAELVRAPSPLALPGSKPRTNHSRQAPESPDPVPYDWKNPETNDEPSALGYKVAPVTHPDHGPAQQHEPMPKPKDANPKKLPSQPVQNPDPVKPEDQASRK